MTSRSGSFLVVCLSMMALMIILAFAILADIREQNDTSTGNQRYLLARAAARAGLDHAVEQILTDYNQTTMDVRTYSANAATPPSVSVPAFTFLDGAYRAPFVSINYPNTTTTWLDSNISSSDDDVRFEDYTLRPMGWWWYETPNWWGQQMYDGRGRYYEPGYYNLAPLSAGSTVPVDATPFTSPSAAVPQRAQAMFYDEQFRRIASVGDLQADRQNARYRLRYAVGVEDLSGHLLINPIPDMQMLCGPGLVTDYRTPAANHPWMTTAINAVAGIAAVNNGGQFGAQLEHIFQGRGYYNNADMDHTPSGINVPTSKDHWPKTFPLMYRDHPEFNPTTGSYDGVGCWNSFIDGQDSGGLTNNLYFYGGGSQGPFGKKDGGEVLPPGGQNGTNTNFWPYPDGSGLLMHCLMGPVMSFENVAYAAHGESGYLMGNPEFDKFAVTPFGRRLTTTGYNPAGPNLWYQGRVDTPLYFNLMTTPPSLIGGMLYAYIQPWVKVYQYTSVSWYELTGYGPTTGWPTFSYLGSNPIDPTLSANQGAAYGRDLMVSSTAPNCFVQWAPPIRADGNPPGANNPPNASGQVISPDYYATDIRPPLTIYPGPFMNGNASISGQAGDDLGLNMDEQNILGFFTNGSYCYGYDVYIPTYFLSYSAGTPSETYGYFQNQGGDPLANAVAWTTLPVPSMPNPNPPPATIPDPDSVPPPGWGTTTSDFVQKNPAPNQILHFYSYYFDLVGAMATAIAVFRTEYVQYGNVWYPNPASLFSNPANGSPPYPNDPCPSSYQSLRDLDRLFLAEMGESLDGASTDTPTNLAAKGLLKAYQPTFSYNGTTLTNKTPPFLSTYVPKNNIWSLVQQQLLHNQDSSVSDAQRAHVMELMLNDFRMSFLGSSPEYSDVPSNPSLEFRPLDFLGDGMAYCSCYGASADKDNLPCAPVGTKPPSYFTLTGTFFIGKSHFYRVTSRGEVWDNLLNHKMDEATLDSVLCVDPEGTDPTQTQFLYQRWFANRYQAMLPAIKR
jgi:hypothetical protein